MHNLGCSKLVTRVGILLLAPSTLLRLLLAPSTLLGWLLTPSTLLRRLAPPSSALLLVVACATRSHFTTGVLLISQLRR